MIMSDLRGLRLKEVDFGWGSAIILASFWFSYTTRDGNPGIIIILWFPPLVMENFGTEMKVYRKE